MPCLSLYRCLKPGLALVFTLVILAFPTACKQEKLNYSNQPNQHLSPKEVIISQLKALQINDYPSADHGIAVAFSFASPNNKNFTGPINRFKEMLNTPSYSALINCKKYKVSEHFVDYNEAQFFVKINALDGRVKDYIFELSRQEKGPFKGFWMTEAVIPIKGDIEDPHGDEDIQHA